MRKLIGMGFFCMGIGMLLMLFISNTLLGLIIIGILLVAGYNCYQCG